MVGMIRKGCNGGQRKHLDIFERYGEARYGGLTSKLAQCELICHDAVASPLPRLLTGRKQLSGCPPIICIVFISQNFAILCTM